MAELKIKVGASLIQVIIFFFLRVCFFLESIGQNNGGQRSETDKFLWGVGR